MNKKVIVISALVLIVLVSSIVSPIWATRTHNLLGITGCGCSTCESSNVKGIQPTDGDICINFNYEGDVFTLTVNKDGTGHTAGEWCQDWAPTGDVTAIGTLLTKFDLTGTVVGTGCCDTIYLFGTIISIGPLCFAVITWEYPSSDCMWGPWTYRGLATKC